MASPLGMKNKYKDNIKLILKVTITFHIQNMKAFC